MALDARIAVGFPTHPKTKKLIRRIGVGGAWSLVCLFLWASVNRSDGDLTGMSDEDIELAAEWVGDDGALVAALVSVRYLDGAEDNRSIHDWVDHNPWAAGSDMRSARARWNAAKRHHGEAEADRLVPEYAASRNAVSGASSNASSTNIAVHCKQPSNAPSPSPSPSPSPKEEQQPHVADKSATVQQIRDKPSCPADVIVSLYHELMPLNPVVKVMNEARRKAIRARWREAALLECAPFGYKDREGGISAWRKFFEVCAESDFLTGKAQAQPGKPPFVADIDFLMSPSGFAKCLENKYHREAA